MSRRSKVGLLVALVAGLFVWSIVVRDEPSRPAGLQTLRIDPPTGAVLVDLIDDADADDRRRLAEHLMGALGQRA